MIETFILVSNGAPERCTVYIAKGEREDVIKKAQSLYHWFTIVTLKPAASQTANPWGGTVLEEVAFTHPTDAFLEAVRYSSLHLRDLPVHQRPALIEKAVEILNTVLTPPKPLTADPRGAGLAETESPL